MRGHKNDKVAFCCVSVIWMLILGIEAAKICSSGYEVKVFYVVFEDTGRLLHIVGPEGIDLLQA